MKHERKWRCVRDFRNNTNGRETKVGTIVAQSDLLQNVKGWQEIIEPNQQTTLSWKRTISRILISILPLFELSSNHLYSPSFSISSTSLMPLPSRIVSCVSFPSAIFFSLGWNTSLLVVRKIGHSRIYRRCFRKYDSAIAVSFQEYRLFS